MPDPISIRPPRRFSPLLPAIGFGVMAVMAELYVTGSPLYGRIMRGWIMDAWDYPFLDLSTVLGWVRCYQLQGKAAYAEAVLQACGVVGPMTYPPVWMHLSFLPTDPAWTNRLGLALVSAFLLATGLLPLPRSAGGRLTMVVVSLSSLPAFAVERANADLLVFLLATGAALSLTGPLPRRLLGYGFCLVGGVLKVYPMVLFLLLLRERPRIMVAVGVAAVVLFAASLLAYADELPLRAAIPGGVPFLNMWGAQNLPIAAPLVLPGLLFGTGTSLIWPPLWTAAPVTILLGVAIVLLSGWLAGNAALRQAQAMLPARTEYLLLVGATLIVGCFFAGQNVAYRGVFLLLVLPGLLALRDRVEDRPLRRILALTIGAILLVGWQLTARVLLGDALGGSYGEIARTRPALAVWLLHELAWWWIAAILLAVLLRFVATSQSVRLLRGGFARVRGLPSATG
ncbi:MAG: hypothetical protein P4L71_18585 [Acetobacteraceae bacterium]|nr:hypothetical protein [Acetobacteraceae bacterium]